MTLRNLVGVLFLLMVFSANVNGQTPPNKPDDLVRAIETGCRARDTKPLASFLQDWHREHGPVAEGVLRKKPAFEQAVYALYSRFYVPVDRSKSADYIIVQGSVAIDLVDADLSDLFRNRKARAMKGGTISRIQIQDFRPVVNVGQKKTLYMDDDHLDVLLRFLTGKDESVLESYWNESNGEVKELRGPHDMMRLYRLYYLDELLDILPGHSGRGWHFETQPYVARVYLHTDFQSAIVVYQEDYSGNEALMRQDKAGWRVVEKKATWIE